QNIYECGQRGDQLKELEDDSHMMAAPPCQCILLLARSSSPAKTTRPLSGRSIPVRMLRIVDLPLPDGPLMAKRLCAGMVKFRLSKITVFWARDSMMRETFSIWTSGVFASMVLQSCLARDL